MDSRQYEKEMKRVKQFQQKIDYDERERVIGNVITVPFRAVGWLVRKLAWLVFILIILAIVASVIQYHQTGNATILEFLRGY